MSDARGKYRIQAVAEITGIPAATLRAWERRYGVPTPNRTSSSYRLYSDADVDLIRRLRNLCDEGMAPSEAAKLLLDEGELAETTPPSVIEDPFVAAHASIVEAIERFDAGLLERRIERACALGPPAAVVDRVFRPVMLEVGDRWHAGTVSIGQEHLATAAITGAILRLRPLVQPQGETRRVVLACFADEEHALCVHALAIHFATWGWDAVVLGARTPPSAVRDAVRELAPELVALSISSAPPGHRARELVDGYADACGDTPWIVGGAALASISKLVAARGGHVADDPQPKAIRALVERVAARPRGAKPRRDR